MKVLAIVVAAAFLSGCRYTAADHYGFRENPTQGAYYEYFQESKRALTALDGASFGLKSPRHAKLVTYEIRTQYSDAGFASMQFATSKSLYPEDAAKLRATADQQIKAATAKFAAKAELGYVDSVGRRAMTSTSPR